MGWPRLDTLQIYFQSITYIFIIVSEPQPVHDRSMIMSYHLFFQNHTNTTFTIENKLWPPMLTTHIVFSYKCYVKWTSRVVNCCSIKKTQLLFVRCIDYLHNRRTFTHTVIYEFMQIVWQSLKWLTILQLSYGTATIEFRRSFSKL